MAASSVLCAASPSGTMLIAFRIIQGMGSSMVFATGVALITSVFPHRSEVKLLV
jgi:MFS family permease